MLVSARTREAIFLIYGGQHERQIEMESNAARGGRSRKLYVYGFCGSFLLY